MAALAPYPSTRQVPALSQRQTTLPHLLGIGGDNAAGAQGSFFEGAVTASYLSTATDDALQANVVSAGYGK